MVSSTPRPHFTPGKDPVPILQEAGWAPGPVWTGEKSRPHRDSIPGRPVRSQYLFHYIPKICHDTAHCLKCISYMRFFGNCLNFNHQSRGVRTLFENVHCYSFLKPPRLGIFLRCIGCKRKCRVLCWVRQASFFLHS